MAARLDPEVIRLLENNGRRFARRGKDSHDIWYSPITKRSFTDELRGLLQSAGLLNKMRNFFPEVGTHAFLPLAPRSARVPGGFRRACGRAGFFARRLLHPRTPGLKA
jgi:hypothetical protein